MQSDDLFAVGNILKATDKDPFGYRGLFIIVCECNGAEGELPDYRFNAVTLKFLNADPEYDGNHASVGCEESWNKRGRDSDLWKLSSLQEVSDAE